MATRINKYLAEQGVCSRRKADELVTAGKVLINGEPATLGSKVSDQDNLVIDGKPLKTRKIAKIYQAFYKPVGLITSVDPKAKDSVRSYLQLENHVFPIGRLDVASSGLLLLTNDGDFAERITHPKYHHEKEYVVSVHRPIVMKDLRTMAEGMMILGSKTKPAKTKKVGTHRFRITLTEGRNRQIRRMCEALDYEVTFLKRVRVMNIELGTMQPGEVRNLNRKELATLKSQLGFPAE